jgi:hypothetical protein
MRWRSPETAEWELVFAFVPHFCFDTCEWVWLEYVWRGFEGHWDGGDYVYRYML